MVREAGDGAAADVARWGKQHLSGNGYSLCISLGRYETQMFIQY
jgi:hypothetical protein